MGETDDAIGWERERMPVVGALRETYAETEPFDGLTVGVATHVEESTGVYAEAVRAAGAEVLLTANDASSVQGDVVADFERRDGVEVFASEGMDDDALADAHLALLDREPDLLLDDGAVLLAPAHRHRPGVADGLRGACEQTTSGIHRVEAMADDGVLSCPVYEVNHARMKWNFDNVHGTGESALANLMLTTNAVVAGTTVVVAGYGHVGRGIADKARSLGATTVVCEVDPCAAMEARMYGHRVEPLSAAVTDADVVVTATANTGVLRAEHLERLPDGALLANAGHFDVEIHLDALEAAAERTTTPRAGITRYHLPDGRRLDLLTEGRLVNLAGPKSEGHPAEVMDITFAMMVRSAVALLDRDLPAGVHGVPTAIDREIAEAKLDALDVDIDEMTPEQRAYLDSWQRDWDAADRDQSRD